MQNVRHLFGYEDIHLLIDIKSLSMLLADGSP